MMGFTKYCRCESWSNCMPQIAAAQDLAFVHGFVYTGRYFNFCPWCGKRLLEKRVNVPSPIREKGERDVRR